MLSIVLKVSMGNIPLSYYYYTPYTDKAGFPNGSAGKESTCKAGDTGDSGSVPGSGRSPGGGHATHSSTLAWRIPWTEEPGGLQSMGSQRVEHAWVTKHSTYEEAEAWRGQVHEWVLWRWLFSHLILLKSSLFTRRDKRFLPNVFQDEDSFLIYMV